MICIKLPNKIAKTKQINGEVVSEIHTVDAQIRIVADAKEGLLLDIGKSVTFYGFRLQKHAMFGGAQGASASLVIRGPEERLFELVDHLSSHARVRSCSVQVLESPPPSVMQPSAAPAAAPVSAREMAEKPTVEHDKKPVAPPPPKPRFDDESIERILPQLAASYPHVMPRLVQLQRELPSSAQEAVLTQIGLRVGSWVYRRDFSRGAKLNLNQSLKQIAVPAIRDLVPAELDGDKLRMKSSPFFRHDHHSKTCHFFSGFLKGIVQGATNNTQIEVEETSCTSLGAQHCCFTLSHQD